jgi:hypothetical protein
MMRLEEAGKVGRGGGKRGSGERGTRQHRALPWSRETSDVVRVISKPNNQ